MILHNVPVANQHLNNGDTLDEDWPKDEPTMFDGVLMNPPYSAKWSASTGFLQDSRFLPYGVLPPKSKADFAFLLHGFYHLKNPGVMAIVLPHGVLFRGGAEGKIRQKLLEDGSIYAVIGLPANIFFNTSIPTTVIILRKDYNNRDVLFIDASKEFEKNKNQNTMTDAHIGKILETYKNRIDVEKYAYVADFEEIKENDFNLNIPRYVDTFEEEPEIPLENISSKLITSSSELSKAKKELFETLGELEGTNEESSKELDEFIKVLGEYNEE